MRLKGLKNIDRIYFIGIGGISMSALAKFLSTCGYTVSGSDGSRGEETENLAFYGVKVYIGVDGSRSALAEADLVVYTDAIAETHDELSFARKSGKRVLARGDLLQLVCENFPHSIAIAGSHGKTTCTSMCTHILKSVRVPFTAHIGGEDSVFGNFYSTGDEYFVTEACEYKQNILKLKAEAAVLLNIDRDHMECYQTEEALKDCFRTYCENAKTAFVCADDKKCQTLGDFATFGIENTLADYRATDLRAIDERYSFTVEEYGKALCRVRLKAIGKCNVYNALAAFAVTRSFGFDEKEIKRGVESFVAVKRRFEKIGTFHGASFVCDYAHHPREIAATIATAEGICKGRLYVVFQPHTYSRTKLLLEEFVRVLRPVKNLMIYKTYPARERYDEEGSAERLAMQVGCLYSENAYVLKTWLKKTVNEKDMVLFLGAGDIYYAAQYLIKEL
ncbi:MAG: UDP-N-acetylmuramate--L-alanine ligase [Clostridia bacterium]|nr:UDP-N-acetylmuramate--L-alanine ligase [Clostridia bacterium]